MNEHTPAQLKAIQTWTEQRDILFRDIGVYSTELNEVKKDSKESGLALADLHKSIENARGRLAEIDALEERWRNSLASDIAELQVRKTHLEGECALLDIKLEAGVHQHAVIIAAVANLESAHAIMQDQAVIINKIAGELMDTSMRHLSDAKGLMVEIKAISDQILEKGNANIIQTNIILEKLPRYIFELQKPIPVRRTYAAPPGTIISPDSTLKPE